MISRLDITTRLSISQVIEVTSPRDENCSSATVRFDSSCASFSIANLFAAFILHVLFFVHALDLCIVGLYIVMYYKTSNFQYFKKMH
jgi:hypothetical protein